jgi:signal transduction histidine kinase
LLKTLFGKLALVLLLLFTLIGVAHTFLTFFTTQRHIKEISQRLHHGLARNLVAEQILMQDGQINQEALEDIFHTLMVINPSIECYLLSSTGDILAFSAPPGTVKRKQVSLEPIHRFLAGGIELPILGDDPRDETRQKIFSASPVPIEPETPATIRETASRPAGPSAGDSPQGYLYIVLGGQEYDSAAEMLQGSYILRLSTGLAVGGLAGALLGGLFLFNVLTRRIHLLAESMDRFRQAQYAAPPDLSSWAKSESGDEIDKLAISFEQMAERISEQMRQLEEKDQLRRALVANVSHDLRTPLATLHGYLETLLLKESQLDPDERKRYLTIATRHSERLGTLIGELFELSKLDSRETELQTEPFSIPELVQDVIQDFQLVARKGGIELQAEFDPNLPFVRGDIRLIERVLDNLLENALRHTSDKGTVTVSLAHDNDRIRVDVRDTGSGISDEDVEHVLDRFYRAKADGSRSTEGSGLGLAISKRILELHGSTIDVRSQAGEGTTFTFHLPLFDPRNRE